MPLPLKVLLTGFEPFGGESINPSLEVVRKLHGHTIDEAQIYGAKLPVLFYKAPAQAIRAIERVRPHIVLGLGLARSAGALTIERVAINLRDGGPDNAGVRVDEEPIAPDGPAAYFATIPVKTIWRQLMREGFRAKISNSAGTYCCNEVMYATLHYIQTQELDMLSGFVHVPRLPALDMRRARSTSMELGTMIRGVESIIRVCVRHLFKHSAQARYLHRSRNDLKTPLFFTPSA